MRTIIVPAAMELLGERNWYLPRWLEWLPNVSVEGHVPGIAPAPTYEAPVAPPGTAAQRREVDLPVGEARLADSPQAE